jgi:hypothetical protein
MKIKGEPRAFLSNEARQLLNLYESLGERAEIFLPRHIYDNLTSFVLKNPMTRLSSSRRSTVIC